MRAGDKVRIFEDPMTEQKFEGDAQLVSRTNTPDVQLEDGSHLEFWLVVFPNGEEAYRKIKVRDAMTCDVCGKEIEEGQEFHPAYIKGFKRVEGIVCSHECANEFLNRKESVQLSAPQPKLALPPPEEKRDAVIEKLESFRDRTGLNEAIQKALDIINKGEGSE